MMKYYIIIIFVSILVISTPAIGLFSDYGTGWGPGAFETNGERIYFTATSKRGTRIAYKGVFGMGMMHGRLACASCHGPNGKGGTHVMHMFVMDAPDIRWSTLSKEEHENGTGEGEGEESEHAHGEYTLEMFRMAVIEAKHPDGKPLKREMPRWKMSKKDLIDLADFLRSLR
jgi:mono/diheme cytochrome c family protein